MSVDDGRMVSADEAHQVLVDLYGLTTGELTGYARDLAHTMIVQAEQIAAVRAVCERAQSDLLVSTGSTLGIRAVKADLATDVLRALGVSDDGS